MGGGMGKVGGSYCKIYSIKHIKHLLGGKGGLWPSRLEAIRPSFGACASGPPTRLGASASQAIGDCLVEPEGSHPPSAPNKNAPSEGRFHLAEREGFEPSLGY